MFEILVLFSVHATTLIDVLFISVSAAPQGSLCLLIGWLVCLRLNTFPPPMHAAQGNHSMRRFIVETLQKGTSLCVLMHQVEMSKSM